MKYRSQVQSYLATRGKPDEKEKRSMGLPAPLGHSSLLGSFVPEIQDNVATNRLIRSRMAEWDLLGELRNALAGAKGMILDPSAPMTLQEEEIPRGAIEVSRAYQAARDLKGNLVVWAGRRKRPASGNRSSGRETDGT